MSLGERIRGLWQWMQPGEPGPDELVVLTVVPLHEGPMTAAALEGAGIPARVDDVSRLPGELPAQARIVVRHADVPEAEAVLRDLRG